jgi:hypothetical protein
MFEVIIERPRGPGWRNTTGRRLGERRRLPDAPLWEPVSRGRGGKELNENLAPLRRFLQSRVGRPWNAVRSEMSAILTPRSAVQKHVLDHVKQMVEENPVLIDGRFCYPPGSGFFSGTPITAKRWWGLYVCPRTGLLRLGPREPTASAARRLAGPRRAKPR